MKKIIFLDNISDYSNSQEYVIVLPQTSSKREVMNVFFDKLEFPDYFGFNWDALLDCLRDLSWIERKGIVIIHTDLPQIGQSDLVIYLETLTTAILDWKEEKEHYIKIVFPVVEEYRHERY